jgi:hypothetical protein
MSGFDDIKESDVVYVRGCVSYGFNSNRYFYLPVNVTKTTKTQFTCSNGKRYAKDSGRQIGGGYGDCARFASDNVTDESFDMKEFSKKASAIRRATNLIWDLDKNRNSINPEIEIELINNFVDIANKLLFAIKEPR